MAVDFAN